MANTTSTPPDSKPAVAAPADGRTAATAADEPIALAASLETARTLPEFFQNWFARVRAGDTGVLPVIAGLIVLAIIFQSLNSHYLTAGNLVNLMVQGSVYMLFAQGMIFVLLIGEIDLSVGFIGGVAGVVTATTAYGDQGWPWYLSLLAGLVVGAAMGLFNGLVITSIGLPSFIVTLAGLLAYNGIMLIVLGNGGTVPINDEMINNLANGLLSPLVGWIVTIAVVVLYLIDMLLKERRRRARGNPGLPNSVVALKVAGVVIAGLAVILICNADRGVRVPIQGMPWVILIVLGFVAVWNILLSRTAFGTYVYAIGGNAEAARRAGISVTRIRVIVFTHAGFMGGVAGLIYASRLRSVSTNLDGGTLVLYCIAAAVIGGTSLFGGRGKAVHAILGGLVIASIDNGMGLLGLSPAARYVVTGVVLVVAVTLDAVASRGRASSGLG